MEQTWTFPVSRTHHQSINQFFTEHIFVELPLANGSFHLISCREHITANNGASFIFFFKWIIGDRWRPNDSLVCIAFLLLVHSDWSAWRETLMFYYKTANCTRLFRGSSRLSFESLEYSSSSFRFCNWMYERLHRSSFLIYFFMWNLSNIDCLAEHFSLEWVHHTKIWINLRWLNKKMIRI